MNFYLIIPQFKKATLDRENKRLVEELEAYFSDPTRPFRPFNLPKGTSFQHKVWQALRSIPVGKTLTYGDLARALKTAPRAIGQACRRNPLVILIPCHRIIGAQHLGGYSGAREGKWLVIKKWLLQHEGFLARS